MDRGTWQATVHGVAKSWTQLSDYHSVQSQVKKQQLALDMEQQTGFKSRKEYVKAVYYHPAYLTYMQIHHAKCQAKAQAGIKIAGRNINNLRYADDITFMAESEEELKTLLKVESEKVGLKLNI